MNDLSINKLRSVKERLEDQILELDCVLKEVHTAADSSAEAKSSPDLPILAQQIIRQREILSAVIDIIGEMVFNDGSHDEKPYRPR